MSSMDKLVHIRIANRVMNKVEHSVLNHSVTNDDELWADMYSTIKTGIDSKVIIHSNSVLNSLKNEFKS